MFGYILLNRIAKLATQVLINLINVSIIDLNTVFNHSEYNMSAQNFGKKKQLNYVQYDLKLPFA